MKFETNENYTESDEAKVLVPHSLTNSSSNSNSNINSNKYEEEDEEDEDEDEREEELNFEKLYLDSIGIYTVLEYALLGSLRCLFKGRRKGLNDDEKNDKKSDEKNSEVKNNSNSNYHETEIVGNINNEKPDDVIINNTTSLPSTLPQPLPLSVDNNCLYCGLAVVNNTRCARCKLPYCGREHQRLHWTVHKVRTYVIQLINYFLPDLVLFSHNHL